MEKSDEVVFKAIQTGSCTRKAGSSSNVKRSVGRNGIHFERCPRANMMYACACVHLLSHRRDKETNRSSSPCSSRPVLDRGRSRKAPYYNGWVPLCATTGSPVCSRTSFALGRQGPRTIMQIQLFSPVGLKRAESHLNSDGDGYKVLVHLPRVRVDCRQTQQRCGCLEPQVSLCVWTAAFAKSASEGFY